MTTPIPTVDHLRSFAASAEELASAILSAYESHLTACDRHGESSPIRWQAFRLPHAAGRILQAVEDLREAANYVDGISTIPANACRFSWGVCPEHGASLASSGGCTWCRTCRRAWNYDRLALPCREAARWLLTDQAGDTRHVCDGHATAARTQLVGARLTLLSDGEDV